MYNICHWLPTKLDSTSFSDYSSFFDYIYTNIFKVDFYGEQPLFNGCPVGARKNPKINGWEEGFYHITHYDLHNTGFENRVVDIDRSERICWVRPIIENYSCNDACCSHIKTWRQKKRIHFLFEEAKFIVVIEERKGYYVIVTSFYVKYTHEMQKKLKSYNKYKDIPIV